MIAEGDNVIFTGSILYLEPGTIGVISKVYGERCTVVYPQNSAYDYSDDGSWKPKKNSPKQIYAHSCHLSELKTVEP